MAAIGAAADTSVRRREADATRARPNRQGAEEVQALKARDNLTNWKHLARTISSLRRRSPARCG
jgi:hypothetical protein